MPSSAIRQKLLVVQSLYGLFEYTNIYKICEQFFKKTDCFRKMDIIQIILKSVISQLTFQSLHLSY